MKIYKLLAISFLGSLIFSCNGSQQGTRKNFALKIEGRSTEFKRNETINVDIENKRNLEIKEVRYTLAGQPVNVTEGKLQLSVSTLGNQELTATVSYDDKTESVSKKITILSDQAPKVYTYTILNEYPHDMKAYTQGLEFYKDTLYESTGKNGQSSLRKVNFKTGEVLKKVDLSQAYFGEGITILNDKVYMLTWRSKTGFVYDVHTFEQLDTFKFENSREGWGLCHDDTRLYKSDGTEKIWILDPATLQEKSFIQTVTNSSIFSKTNELEYVDGKIYANSYQKDGVMIINPETGAIEGVVDFRGLKEKVAQHPDLDVLNGIAYNPASKTFFVTGKNWDKLFEVQIEAKQ